MSTSTTARTPHRSHLLVFLLLLLPALACKAVFPSTPTAPPDRSDGIRITYATGIQTIRLDSGMIVAADLTGSYCMGFPAQWEVGAFHADFIPTVDHYAETNHAIKSLFEQLYGNDSSLRLYAIDTSPGHLTETSFAVLHVGMFQEEWRLKLSMEELTEEYMAYLGSSGQLKVTDTLSGKTKYEVPFVIILTESMPTEGVLPVHSAAVLLKTDYTYLEMHYTTLDESINIVDELNPILTSFATCHE